MSDDLQLQQAIKNADAAGDRQAAQALVAELLRRRGVKAPKEIRNSDQTMADPLVIEARNVAGSMSLPQQIAAGAGKAASDPILGVRQMTGNASQEEVDEVKQRDAPLMETPGGMAGNIAGNVALATVPGLGLAGVGKSAGIPALAAAGKYALSSPATLGGAATQGAMGAAQSALQPVATGENRMQNAMAGFAGGAAVPLAGMAFKGAKAAVEPLYEGGRQQILARALRSATGNNADDIITRLSQSRELVPGSAPTAAEVGQSGGLAAMQRAAAAVDPEAYATRAAQQNEARVSALQKLAGSDGRRAAMTAIRDEGADEMYAAARKLGVNKEMSQVLQPQIKNLVDRMPSGVMEKAKELARLNGEVLDQGGSVNGLHWMKLAVDDMLSSGKQTGIGTQTTRALTQFKNDLTSVIDDLSPTYGQARSSFAEMSRIPNQMDVASTIADKSVNPLTGQLKPQQFATALSDDTARAATGFNKATLANTLEPEQLSTLNAIRDDLARSVQARDLGRGAGSDTVQKLAMTNLMERSGIPVGVLNLPGVGRIGNWAYSVADDKMKQVLAETLLDPKATAQIMQKGVVDPKTKAMIDALRMSLAPAAIGTTPALLDAR